MQIAIVGGGLGGLAAALFLRQAGLNATVYAIRRPRANHVQLMSRGREVRNHLPDGLEQQQRDTEFTNGDLLRQSAWLYGYDVDT